MQNHRPVAMRVESKDVGTGLTTVTYIGTLEENRQRRIEEAKEACGVAILDQYPEYKQANAALGLYDQLKVSEIKTGIQTYRVRCDQIESELIAASTLEDIWNVVIDFT